MEEVPRSQSGCSAGHEYPADAGTHQRKHFQCSRQCGAPGNKSAGYLCRYGRAGTGGGQPGAEEAVLIDQATGRILRENVRRCRAEGKVRILQKDAERALLSLKGETFDYIFLDPPYRKGYVNEILHTVIELGLPAEGAVIIAEHVSAEPLDFSMLGDNVSLWKEKNAERLW